MAAWGLSADELRTIVGGAKRSESYRRLRPELVSVCPADVWVEDGLGFVQFEVDGQGIGRTPGWIVFAVVADGVDANSDLFGSAEYRSQMARVYTARALTQALSRAS